MKRSLSTAVAALLTAVVLTGCSSGLNLRDGVSQGGSTAGEAVSTPAPESPSLIEEAAQLVRGMPVEQKVGQLFMIRRQAVTDVALQSGKAGGVIFFGENNDFEGSATEVASRTAALQKTAVAHGTHLPLLIATDEEYGSLLRRLTESQATIFPGNMALDATDDPALAEAAGKAGGIEMKALGFNVNFAPDVDVNYNPRNPVIGIRSFGDDPVSVADMSARAVKGYQEGGVAATAKHFPGHGNTNVDSHTNLPVIHDGAEEFKRNNLPPFKASIDAGVDMVMTGHIKVPALDPAQPASLSRPVTTDLLRRDLGFKGVVVTDSLEMEGVNTGFSPADIAVHAFLAGADILLMPPDLDVAYNALLNEVKPGGRISMQALDAAVTRIIALKLKYGLKPAENPSTDSTRLKSPEAAKTCADIGTQSVTLLSGNPAFGGDRPVFVTGFSDSAVGTLQAQFPGSTAWPMGTDDYSREQIAEGVAKVPADPRQVIVLSVSSPASHELNYVRALKATGRPVYVVLVRLPYAGAYTDMADATIAAYGSTSCSMQAVAKVLRGTQKAEGTLPVNLPDGSGAIKYKRGHAG